MLFLDLMKRNNELATNMAVGRAWGNSANMTIKRALYAFITKEIAPSITTWLTYLLQTE